MLVFIPLVAAALQGCGGGPAVQQTAPATTQSPPPSSDGGAGGGASHGNVAPTISGSPATQATEGADYSFAPRASDADGDSLTFSIANKPAWGSFNASTGVLTGKPAAGTFSNIVISVSDGTSTASLVSFSITVAAAGADTGTGVATVSWLPPTTRSDGSVLTNLAGYKIYYGTSGSELDHVITIDNAGLASYVVERLSTGTYYFAVSAFDSDGLESAQSTVGSKVIT